MRNLKNNKAITLISLIVTIIVLLILSGVGIAMLTGENSIVKKAIQAKKATSEAEAKERVQIEVLGSIDNKGNIDKDELKNNLRNNLGVQDNQIVDPNEGTDFNDPFDFPLGDYDVRVNPNGKVEIMPKGEIPTPPTLNDGDIIFSVNPSTLTNEEVQVAVKVNSSINSMRLTLQYALEQPDEEESWQAYKRPITFKDNGPIYARLINEKGQKSNHAAGNINNIDKQPPTIDEFKVVEDSITLNSVQVQVTASDNRQLASKDTYKFFAKEENGALYPTSDYKLKGVESQGEFTYKDLTPSKKYELKVIVTDEVGNTAEQSINNVQMKMPELNVGGEESPDPTGTPDPGGPPLPNESQKANITFKYSYTEWNNRVNR